MKYYGIHPATYSDKVREALKREMFSVRLPRGLLRHLRKHCKDTGQPYSHFVQRAIVDYLAYETGSTWRVDWDNSGKVIRCKAKPPARI